MSVNPLLLGWWPGLSRTEYWREVCPLPSDPTSCWLPLDMELLHRQVLALQAQRVLLGTWPGGLPKESSSLFQVLTNRSLPLHRKAAEGVSLAAEPGLPSGHAVLAGADGGFRALVGTGISGSLVL